MNTPDFFVPAASSPEQSALVWQSIKQFAAETLGWQPTDRRVYSVRYRHNGKNFHSIVGEPHEVTRELVCAILETAHCWLICTPNRGVVRGSPILIGIPSDFTEFSTG